MGYCNAIFILLAKHNSSDLHKHVTITEKSDSCVILFKTIVQIQQERFGRFSYHYHYSYHMREQASKN